MPILLGLVSCGDSGSDQPSAASVASVNAGGDIQVLEGQTFTLTAAVYPEGGSIVWSQRSGPAISEFPTEFTLSLDLTTPSVNIDTDVEFEALYTAPNGQVVSDTVTVTVTNVNAPPVANAVVEGTSIPPYRTYEQVTLSATNSTDADGEIRGYQWQQIDTNPEVEAVTDLTSETFTFVAPFVPSITNYKFRLTVTDNFGLSDANEIDIQIAASEATLAANAGADQIVDEFTQVELDGSDSVSSVSDVTCNWTQTSGTQVTIVAASACETEFVAPDVDSVDVLVFKLTVTDETAATEDDTVNITVNPLNLGNLQDTGVTDCYDNNQIIECGDSSFPKQDADMGRDAVRDVLDKSGSGAQAFDFTKFDANGDEISNDALVFECVRDNFTGLIWEVKQPTLIPEFGQLRGVENTYSFDDTLPAANTCPSADNCGVEAYVAEVNQQSFCGGANWRLPTYMELLSLMNYSDVDQDSLLDTEFFPYSPNAVALGHKFYWVSDASAEGGAERFNWVLDMETGDDAAILVGAQAYIRLVRRP